MELKIFEMNYTRCKQRGINYKSMERSELRGI